MSVVHRTYARALYNAAVDAGRVAPAREQFDDFAEAVREVPELRGMLRNPQLDVRAKRAVVDAVLGDAPEAIVRNFLLLLVEKGRGAEVEETAREFDRLVDAAERRISVELTTAFELSDDEAREIVGQIERASGMKVEAERSVDPSLIGGLVLQAGSHRVDASVRGRLERLGRELVSRA